MKYITHLRTAACAGPQRSPWISLRGPLGSEEVPGGSKGFKGVSNDLYRSQGSRKRGSLEIILGHCLIKYCIKIFSSGVGYVYLN
jgi:hypothetical protein